MKPFRYRAVADVPAALSGGSRDGSKFIAGGTTLLDLWKLGAVAPDELLDINGLPLAAIERSASGLRLGALARMSDVAAHPEVARDFPLIATALLESASPQIRNMASLGGNPLQRPR
ncbi:MAG TPA: FAD binding domain-containing protein, partial [Thermoanaerobaculia bacterium]|nr:FAD binding domain-containing protein [Thermoanaerobaculia bacterium]